MAVCETYLDFATRHPQRYRTMFGGLWTPTPGDSSLTETDLVMLGAASMLTLVKALGDCVAAGEVTSTDVPGDATALWVGLHGLAHQRVVARPSLARGHPRARHHLTRAPEQALSRRQAGAVRAMSTTTTTYTNSVHGLTLVHVHEAHQRLRRPGRPGHHQGGGQAPRYQ
ncbi:TetR-like C-terminal domain-containing protein [Streptomyces sp. M19]